MLLKRPWFEVRKVTLRCLVLLLWAAAAAVQATARQKSCLVAAAPPAAGLPIQVSPGYFWAAPGSAVSAITADRSAAAQHQTARLAAVGGLTLSVLTVATTPDPGRLVTVAQVLTAALPGLRSLTAAAVEVVRPVRVERVLVALVVAATVETRPQVVPAQTVSVAAGVAAAVLREDSKTGQVATVATVL